MIQAQVTYITLCDGVIRPTDVRDPVPAEHAVILGPATDAEWTRKGLRIKRVTGIEEQYLPLNQTYGRLFYGGCWYSQATIQGVDPGRLNLPHRNQVELAYINLSYPTIHEVHTTALCWHGGQASPLYSFGSTEKIHSASHLSEAINETVGNLQVIEGKLLTGWTSADAQERMNLTRLLCWLENHRPLDQEYLNLAGGNFDHISVDETTEPRKVRPGVWAVRDTTGEEWNVVRHPCEDDATRRAWVITDLSLWP